MLVKHSMCTWLRSTMAGVAFACLANTASANNVQASLEGSLLVVHGDSLPNDVVITQNQLGTIVIRGRNGTTVNGLLSVTFPRVALNAAEIRMEGGNDLITLSGLSPANDLYVNLGAGNDRLTSSNLATIGANATVEGAEGNDVIRLSNLNVMQDLFIDGGTGTLQANLSGINGGKGITVISDVLNDTVTIGGSTAAEYLAVETKAGNDSVVISSSVALGLAVATDLGTDSVSISDLLVTEDIGVFTGIGNDTVTLSNASSSKSLTVSVDEGADYVRGSGVSAAEDAIFEGGAGVDTLEDLGISGGIKKEIKEFEIILP